MRILLLTLGTRGDFELHFTLALELLRRGHDVTLATSGFFSPNLSHDRFHFSPIGGGTKQELLRAIESLAAVPDRTERIRRFYIGWLRPQITASTSQIAALAARADYVVSGLKMIMRRSNHVIPTAAITYDLPPDLADLAKSPTRGLNHNGPVIDLVAMNKPLIDPVGNWDADYHFTGFWLRHPAPAQEVNPALDAFLARGSPPIIVTLGSMVLPDAARFLDLLRAALDQSHQRAVLVRGWSNISADFIDDRLCCVSAAPYHWLFSRAACVVHHGGSGTVAAALAAATPSIVLPSIASQEQFGRVLIAHGLATGLFDLAHVSSEELASAIDKAVNDHDTRETASRWQHTIAQDPGVHAAAELIERHWRELKG